MRLAVYLPLVVPLLAGVAARPVATRLPPRLATWLLTGSAVALAGASTVGLGLLAVAAAIRVPFVAELGDMSLRVVRRDDPASLAVAVSGAVLLTAVVGAAGRAGWRRIRALVVATRQARCLPGSAPVVVVPDVAADAYALPGRPARIVVTAGMLEALTPRQRRVLLAHERAHADGRHYLFTAVADLAAAANPLLRPLAAAVGYTVERWADERAAAACGDRGLAARTVATAALAAARRQAVTPPRAAMGMTVAAWPTRRGRDTGRRRPPGPGRAGPVPRRVAALLQPPPRLRPLLVAVVVALVLVSGVAALDAARDLHAVVELAQMPGAS